MTMISTCIKCCERPATHASIYGEKLCEECRRAPDNPDTFAILAARRKEAFSAITESLSEPIQFEPGRTYPNHIDAIYPDCPMCIFRPCSGTIMLGKNGANVGIGLTCGTPECLQAWAALKADSENGDKS
jgi:hypothetical protein